MVSFLLLVSANSPRVFRGHRIHEVKELTLVSVCGFQLAWQNFVAITLAARHERRAGETA